MARRPMPRASVGGLGLDQNDTSRMPLNIDKDDVEFLQQFPTHLWHKAQAQRYEKLFDALEKLHSKRVSMMKELNLEPRIAYYLETGSDNPDYEPLEKEVKDFINDEYDIPLKPENGEANERFVKERAKSLAFEYVKSKTQNLKQLGLDPDSVEFNVHAGRGKKYVAQSAKPFFNRLYHKLERTKGEKHIDGSENDGVGQYGYDLSHPIRVGDKKQTQGMAFSAAEEWNREQVTPAGGRVPGALEKYLLHSSHAHFGDAIQAWVSSLPKSQQRWIDEDYIKNNIKYCSVTRPGKTPDSSSCVTKPEKSGKYASYLEDPTYDWMLEDLTQKIQGLEGLDKEEGEEFDLEAPPEDGGGKKKKTKKTSSQARQEALEIMNKLVAQGKIHAPSVEGIPDEDRMFRLSSSGEVIKPPALIPHLKKVTKDEDGGKSENWVPLLLPSQYLEKVDKIDPEYEALLNSSLKKWKSSPHSEDARLPVFRGHSQRAGAQHLDLRKRKGIVTFGPVPNTNQKTSHFIDPHSKKGREIIRTYLKTDWQNIDGQPVQVVKDFVKAIRSTLKSTSMSGGAPAWLRRAAQKEISSMHSLVYNLALNDLGSEDLQHVEDPDESESFFNPRVSWAGTKVSAIMQRPYEFGLNLGEEAQSYTRRRGERGATSMAQDSQGKDIQFGSDQGGRDYIDTKRGRGDKAIDAKLSGEARADMVRKAVAMATDLKRQTQEAQSVPRPTAPLGTEKNLEEAKNRLSAIARVAKGEEQFIKDIEPILRNLIPSDEVNALVKQWKDPESPSSRAAILQNIESILNIKGISSELQPKRPPVASAPVAKPSAPQGGGLAAKLAARKAQQQPDTQTPVPQDPSTLNVDWNLVKSLPIRERVSYLRFRLKN